MVSVPPQVEADVTCYPPVCPNCHCESTIVSIIDNEFLEMVTVRIPLLDEDDCLWIVDHIVTHPGIHILPGSQNSFS